MFSVSEASIYEGFNIFRLSLVFVKILLLYFSLTPNKQFAVIFFLRLLTVVLKYEPFWIGVTVIRGPIL